MFVTVKAQKKLLKLQNRDRENRKRLFFFKPMNILVSREKTHWSGDVCRKLAASRPTTASWYVNVSGALLTIPNLTTVVYLKSHRHTYFPGQTFSLADLQKYDSFGPTHLSSYPQLCCTDVTRTFSWIVRRVWASGLFHFLWVLNVHCHVFCSVKVLVCAWHTLVLLLLTIRTWE